MIYQIHENDIKINKYDIIMNTLKCEKCNKEFKTKHGYQKHINKQIPCKENEKQEYLIKIRTCNRCNKVFQRPNLLVKHQIKCNINVTSKQDQPINSQDQLINSRVHSNNQNSELIIGNDCKSKQKYQCQYCEAVFTLSSSLARHIKNRCKIKKNQDQQKENLITFLIKEREDQRKKEEDNIKLMDYLKRILENKDREMANKDKQIKQIMKKMESMENMIKNTNTIKNTQKANNIQNNTNCNNNIQNINNNIKIIAYGKEDLSHILEKDYKIILNKGFKSVPALMESIHFNKNKPENHNIYISNMRDNHLLIYDGNDWQLKERDDILQDIVYNKTDILSEKFDELVDRLDEPTTKKFNRFLDKRDDDAVINSIKKDLKLMMYNKRKVVENTKSQLFNNNNYNNNIKTIEES